LTSELSRIKRNSFFSFISISIRLLANIILFLIIARFYGPEKFGQFTYAHTLATIFILFADFGFDVLLTTEVAKNRDKLKDIFESFFSFKVLFALIAISVMSVISIFQDISQTTRTLIFIFSLYTGFTALMNYFFDFFNGMERLQYETKISFVINLIIIFLILFLAYFKFSIIIIASTFVLTRMIGFFLSMKKAFSLVPNISFNLNFRNWGKIKNQVMTFGIHLLFGNLFFQLDTLMIAFYRSDAEVGIYQSVFKLVALPLVIPEVFISSLMPVLARLNVEDKNQWKRYGFLMNKSLILIALPILTLLFVFSEQIIAIIYGLENYSDAILILRVFSIIIFIRFAVETYALMLTTSNRQNIRMIVVVLATFINFLINIIVIPEYGLWGAALTALVTNIFVGFGYIIMDSIMFKEWIFRFDILIPLLTTIILTYLLYNFNQFSMFYLYPIFLIVYFPIFFLIGFDSKERKTFLSGKGEFRELFIKTGKN